MKKFIVPLLLLMSFVGIAYAGHKQDALDQIDADRAALEAKKAEIQSKIDKNLELRANVEALKEDCPQEPVNTPPTVSTPLPDISVNTEAGQQQIDLNQYFTDTEDTTLIFSVNPSVPGLFTTITVTNNILNITYAGVVGTSEVTVTATDSGGLSVTDTFNVNVVEAPTEDLDRRSLVNLTPKVEQRASYPIVATRMKYYEHYRSDTGQVDYIRQARNGKEGEVANEWLNGQFHLDREPGQDLVIINPDGTETVIVDCDETQSVIDPYVSVDGTKIAYTLCNNLQIGYDKPQHVRSEFEDIYVYDTVTQQHTLVAGQDPDQKYINMNPCFLPDGRLTFTRAKVVSQPESGVDYPTQLHVIDLDGKNLQKTGFLNIRGAQHPVLMPDGTIAWSTGESMGTHGGPWGIWASNPDCSTWKPLASAYTNGNGIGQLFHFHTPVPKRTGETLNRFYFTSYYQASNFSGGDLYGFLLNGKFGPVNSNEGRASNNDVYGHLPRLPFLPGGLETFEVIFSGKSKDANANIGDENWNNKWTGKVTMPFYAPDGVLAIWGGQSPNNTKKYPFTPVPLGQIIFIHKDKLVKGLDDFTVVRVDTSKTYSYNQAVPLVPYASIFGEAPPVLPWIQQEQHEDLPKGSPFTIVGSDSVYTRESNGEETGFLPFISAGGDVIDFENSDIEYIRFIGMHLEDNPKDFNPNSFSQHWPERFEILGDIPLRKFNADGTPKLDSNGDPDTSFWAKIPADFAYTFALLDSNKQQLSIAQTWHQGRPGEVRTDCKGCHAHHEPSTVDFASTEAFKLKPTDLTQEIPKGYYFERDIKPILDTHCASCHEDDDNMDAMSLVNRLKSNHKVKFHLTQPGVPFQSHNSEMVRRMKLPVEDPEHMPADGTTVPAQDLDTIITWLDMGRQTGVHHDGKAPTLHIETPRRKVPQAIMEIKFGAFDYYGFESITVHTSWLNGDQFSNFTEEDSVYTMQLPAPVTEGWVEIVVTDTNGNVNKQRRDFTLK